MVRMGEINRKNWNLMIFSPAIYITQNGGTDKLIVRLLNITWLGYSFNHAVFKLIVRLLNIMWLGYSFDHAV